MTPGWALRIGLALATGLLLILYCLRLPTWLDALWPWSHPPASSPAGWVALVLAWSFNPAVLTGAVLLLSWWMARRRLRRVAAQLIISTLASLALATVLKALLARPRPASPWELGLAHTASFPSDHATGASMLALCLISAALGLRWPFRRRVLWAFAWSVFVLVVCFDRLFLRVHHVSDIVAGILTSVFAHAVATAATYFPARVRAGAGRSLAVVLNPSKVRSPEVLIRLVTHEAKLRGWQIAGIFSTTKGAPGNSQAHAALAAGAGLLLVAGGDGTQRAVCGAVAHTGATLGVLPHGAGDLFARALGVPGDLIGATCAALDGAATDIDVLRLRVDEREEIAIAMAGVGADARVLQDTSVRLKRALGALSYLLAGAGHLAARPSFGRVTADGAVVYEGEISQVEVGNVGELRSGVALLPGASVVDGALDLLVAAPRRTTDVVRMIIGVLAGARSDRHLIRARATTLVAEFAEPVPCQADGELVGEVTSLSAEVDPSAVLVVAPSLTA